MAGEAVSALEALVNAVIGLVVSWLVTWLWLGFNPVQSVQITAAFFGLSFARAYVIRRIFRGLE